MPFMPLVQLNHTSNFLGIEFYSALKALLLQRLDKCWVFHISLSAVSQLNMINLCSFLNLKNQHKSEPSKLKQSEISPNFNYFYFIVSHSET